MVAMIIEERRAQLESLRLARGSHEPGDEMCAMEAAAWLVGEPWSDAPKCVSPVISEFLRSWNDSLADDDRQMLKPLIPKVIGTTRNKRDEERRAWMAVDWLVRECAPAFLRLAGLTEHAEMLEGLAPLTDALSAKRARPKLAAAADAAADAAARAAVDAATNAAADAAVVAAADAAWAAAADAAIAAWAAGTHAAIAAARAAAAAAAWNVARVAARVAAADAVAALEPTVKTLRFSALRLVGRMAEVGR